MSFRARLRRLFAIPRRSNDIFPTFDSMKCAVLIQAHRGPEQVARLCRALSHPVFDLYIGVDRKTEIAPFRLAVPSSVRFIRRRIDVRWGAFSQVEATLYGLEEILKESPLYDFILFISGQDYPLLPPARIAEELARHPGAQFMCRTRVEEGTPACDRYRYPHVHFGNRTLTRGVNRLLRLVSPGRRKFPLPAAYKGSSWWTLSGSCAEYITRYARTHPRVVRFFRRAHCPDEFFFQSIVLDSPFAASVIPDNFRYVDWSDGRPNPRTLTEADYDRLAASGCWFARKFDAEQDSRILDRLDRRLALLSEEATRTE